MNYRKVSVVHTEIVKEKSVLYGNGKNCRITSAKEAVDFANQFYYRDDKEKIHVCSLDGKGEPVTMELVAIGSARTCTVGIPEMFKTAILSNACGIIFFHNHPSGSCTPSRRDREVTEKLREAGDLLDIPLVDHIILGAEGAYYSFSERGILS